MKRMQKTKKFLKNSIAWSLFAILTFGSFSTTGMNIRAESADTTASEAGQEVTLRISNWEEYIDEGEWGEDEVIDLESGDIFGENSLLDDFSSWYEETYGIRVNIEYSTFGTNEDLYNMLTLGDRFDLICPSEYMFMKLMSEDKLTPLSEAFFDEATEENYYIKGVSPYLKHIFDSHEINGETWSKYAAGYMWGITGFVYNPELITEDETSTWKLIANDEYKRQITIKDNVRDSYFAAVGALQSDLLTSDEFINDEEYAKNLEEVMNNTSTEEIQLVQDYLQNVKDNVYSFETDSGKSDMITGKVVANYQWSGDAVYTMDQADEDGVALNFAVPKESTNIYFDGWVMLKDGIAEDDLKQHAAEAFINFLSRPDNAIRNMYYIGYTSFISAAEDGRIFEYLDWNYGPEEESEAVVYDLNYFFNEEATSESEDYQLLIDEEQIDRQLGAQYPSPEVMKRSSIMRYFTPEQNTAINKMWVNVRCYNIQDLPVWGWVLAVASCLAILYLAGKKIAKWVKNR